jgi:hypothetical protein
MYMRGISYREPYRKEEERRRIYGKLKGIIRGQ